LHEVTAPDVVGVVLDEGRPPLATTAVLEDGAHVLLKGPLAQLYAEFQEPTVLWRGGLFDRGENSSRTGFAEEGVSSKCLKFWVGVEGIEPSTSTV
jgi:hypothetical protein